MRLIETSTFELSEFIGSHIPFYAILSHRWIDSEVTYQELRNGTWHEVSGASKLRGCCAQAAKDGFQWVWIDSCCIDKSSSAELSEAINSMFKWYEGAQVCYAYLYDVTSSIDNLSNVYAEFRRSEWFTRGWTLQELLAPQCVEFYNRDWVEIGTKSSLAEMIKKITGINRLFNYELACVAQKMSWMARRETTREEDIAYCLMGLFGVNMPTLYGEGSKAFLRLQQEILSKSEDESIFAWEGPLGEFHESGLLAHSPKWFGDCAHVQKSRFDLRRLPHTMTNRGLRMELLIATKGAERNGERLVIAPLNCKKMLRAKHGSEITVWKTVCLSLLGNWDDGQVRFYTRRRGLVYDVAVANAANQDIFRRETFFFKQPELVNLNVLRRRPDLLILRAQTLLELGFRPEGGGGSVVSWDIDKEDEPCLRYLSFGSEIATLRFSHISSKLIFRVGRSGETGQLWIDACVGTNELSVPSATASITAAKATILRKDRVSLSLEDGTGLCFALKNSIHSGKPAYVVDVTIDAEGQRRRVLETNLNLLAD